MRNKKHTFISITIVIIFGLILFYVGTDGYKAFTAESARTYDLVKNKPKFPSVTLQDSKNRTYDFKEFADGKYVFITFMYTNCGTVCPQLELNMEKVYHLIPDKYIGEEILFLSLSFDPNNDDPETLSKYRIYFGSDGETWRMARIPDEDQLELLLDTLGVIVIPDDYGNFQHNTAFYLINQTGHLQEVMDYTEIEDAALTVNSYLNKTGVE